MPASDRVVSLKHNSADYKEAVSSLEKVIQEFRADHHLDNELGPEKGALLQTLEVGRTLLEDTQIKVDIAVTTIVQPLKIIKARYDEAIEKYGDAIVQGAVSGAVAAAFVAILKLLGLG